MRSSRFRGGTAGKKVDMSKSDKPKRGMPPAYAAKTKKKK